MSLRVCAFLLLWACLASTGHGQSLRRVPKQVSGSIDKEQQSVRKVAASSPLRPLASLLLHVSPAAGWQINRRGTVLLAKDATDSFAGLHPPVLQRRLAQVESPKKYLTLRMRGGAAKMTDDAGMPYRLLGNTGLAVSVLSFGFWATYGAKGDLKDTEGIEMAKKCMRVARDAGVNLFDNAEVYGEPLGSAEVIMGEALKQLQAENETLWRRSDLVVTTKIFWGGKGVNERGLSLKHLREGMDASLTRLQMDYVDLVFCHRPDPYTPTETVVRGMSDLVRSGKATAWGTSEWSAAQIVEAVWIARTHGLEPPQFEQPQYNMMHRDRFESEYFPIFREPYNIGTTIWSPLASGLLTGKYVDGEIPAGSRAAAKGYEMIGGMVDQWAKDGKMEKVKALMAFAKKELKCSVSQLAVAWCLKNPNVTTCLLGATKPEQLEETLGAVQLAQKLTDAHMEKIDEILGNKPQAYLGYGAPGWMRSINVM